MFNDEFIGYIKSGIELSLTEAWVDADFNKAISTSKLFSALVMEILYSRAEDFSAICTVWKHREHVEIELNNSSLIRGYASVALNNNESISSVSYIIAAWKGFAGGLEPFVWIYETDSSEDEIEIFNGWFIVMPDSIDKAWFNNKKDTDV